MHKRRQAMLERWVAFKEMRAADLRSDLSRLQKLTQDARAKCVQAEDMLQQTLNEMRAEVGTNQVLHSTSLYRNVLYLKNLDANCIAAQREHAEVERTMEQARSEVLKAYRKIKSIRNCADRLGLQVKQDDRKADDKLADDQFLLHLDHMAEQHD